MDDWEEEEGDKEDIDENEVREQVGRAHMKTMLDQDQREVRLFQELFLEDGDLHSDGGGRQRQFRWKQADGENTEETVPVQKIKKMKKMKLLKNRMISHGEKFTVIEKNGSCNKSRNRKRIKKCHWL
ncbi:claspin-like [Daphnia magna]|uniref:claspin-like n=1 Tax=Daphnia magna TaxID=35525 RepID=UPI001E1BC531|nr:claspin-like [Daphnia magna]